MKAVFMGLGYIGLPTAAVAAGNGIEVLGVDVNPGVVETINEGRIHILEPGLDRLVKEVVGKGLLRAAPEPEPADAFFVVVPTPFKQNHRPDISFVEAAVRMLLPVIKEENLLVIESTSPVGTTEKMAEMIFRERPELKGRVHIAYCPERVLPGNVLYELEHNDRVIGGLDEGAAEKAAAFYARFVKGTLHKTKARTAEMCKLTENASRDAEIAFANELSMICDKAGVDVWELIELANKHPRVNILRPGCGVGGHCIAVDPWFLVADYYEQAAFLKTVRETNDHKADWCAEKVLAACAAFERERGKKPVVACMGLAFKPDIDDLRESPAKYIAGRIAAEAGAEVLVAEPNIVSLPGFKVTPWEEAYRRADVVAWLVAHREFRTLAREAGKVEVDVCGVRGGARRGGEFNSWGW